MGKPISSVMQRVISPVHMDDTIDTVEGVMKAHRISSVPVYADGGAILGIITTTDLVRHHTTGKESAAVKAWELCTYKPLQVPPDTAVTKVAELMIEHRVHHVLVMAGSSVEGIVSSLDFVKLYLDECRD
jgi:CBS domain-containing protein